ncbi:MAG: glycoside hydrolase family 2 TIM barrel-domain containing protein [Bacteroidota bacterium]|nr:glycoside hydrolase family 2 TIM barrel-domain containing protein [Bacteroidota bacterium]
MMIRNYLRSSLSMLIIFLLGSNIFGQPAGRHTENFNFGWKFWKGDVKDGQDPSLDDSGWRILDLPHDWSIEGPFSKTNYSCTAYLPGGTGWYRKTFSIPGNESGRKIFLAFDGAYNNSEAWVNGRYLGKRPDGYISFQYDISGFVNFGKDNIVAVKLDHSLFGDSRWYTGSGIYRNVYLISEEPVHIKQWGIYCKSSEITSSGAKLSADISVVNETDRAVKISVVSTLNFGSEKVKIVTSKISLDKKEEKTINQVFDVVNPKLWDTDNPELYSLVTEVRGRELLDNVVTNVGFRDLKFDPEKGFFLNGKSLKLKGICMHHDAGTLGSAVPKEEIARRLDLLKEMGCNAIRTSHNPFSPEFLDLCDSKGFLVIGEAFDEWELPKNKWLAGWNAGTPGKEGYSVNFREWAKKDLRDFILRDRNHPSVIMWSIGNEVDYPNDPYTHEILNTEENPQTFAKFNKSLPHANRLGEIARELVAVIRDLDKTRPITAGLASALMSNVTGYADALDVAGYNYQESRYEKDHKKYPNRPLYGSENGMTLEMWNYVADNDYVMGQFLWTGFDYMGEAGRYPSRSNTAGVLDLAGNKKPEFYFRQSLWSDKPMVFIGTTDRSVKSGPDNLWSHKRVEPLWNWNEDKTISVNAFTNCEEVELFLNNRSLGSKKMADFANRTISWDVPFEKGTLKAVASNSGKPAAEYELITTGAPVKIITSCAEDHLKANRQDISHIYVTLCDESGNTVYSADNQVTCDIEGPVRLLGMEDSNPSNTEDYKDNKQHAFHGKLLIYVQAMEDAGPVKISLTSPGLAGCSVELNVVK